MYEDGDLTKYLHTPTYAHMEKYLSAKQKVIIFVTFEPINFPE